MKKLQLKIWIILAISFTFFNSCSKSDSPATVNPPVVPNAGTVAIGSQTWMLKNLDVDHYRNGDVIPQVTDPSAWAALTTGAWCYYNNDSANGPVYGKLYNWYAVTDPRGLAPTGYHVPSDAEWATLTTFLGGEFVAGDKMKATTLWPPCSGITNTNSSGFTGLPGGCRDYYGLCSGVGFHGYWWSTSEYAPNYTFYRNLYYSDSTASSLDSVRTSGFSVRCLRD